MAIESQGSIVFFSTSTVLSTAAAAKVGEVTGFTGPSGSAAVIDITSLSDTAKSKMIGLRDEGNVTIDINYVATDAVQTKLRECRAARTKSCIAIGFTDGSSSLLHCECYITNFSITGAVDNVVKASITAELTGPITWTTFTA